MTNSWPKKKFALGIEQDTSTIRIGSGLVEPVVQTKTATIVSSVNELSGVIRFRRPISKYRVPVRVRG